VRFSAWITVLLVLAVGMPAFATVGDTQWWQTKGPAISGGETPVSSWWASAYSSEYAYPGNWEQTAEYWYDHRSASAKISLEVAGNAPYNEIGWQEITWSTSQNEWVLTDATAGNQGSKWDTIVPGNSGSGPFTYPEVKVSNFVLYLRHTSDTYKWYSMDSLNSDSWTWTSGSTSETAPYRHAWVFDDPTPLEVNDQPAVGGGWVLAWEDLAASSADDDHNDIVIKFALSAGGGGSGPPVPEIPPTLLAGVIPVIALAMRRFRK